MFSVANVRRKKYGADKPNEWFSVNNKEGEEQRHQARVEALEDMKAFLVVSLTSRKGGIFLPFPGGTSESITPASCQRPRRKGTLVGLR